MTDWEFLGYVDIHSETWRALFSREMVKRFLVLAGENPEAYDLRDDFITMHRDDIKGLLARARANVCKQA